MGTLCSISFTNISQKEKNLVVTVSSRKWVGGGSGWIPGNIYTGKPIPCWTQALLSRNILPFSSFGNFPAILAPSNSYFTAKGFKSTPCEDSITGKKILNVAIMLLVPFCLFNIDFCNRSPSLPTSRQQYQYPQRLQFVQCPGFRVKPESLRFQSAFPDQNQNALK